MRYFVWFSVIILVIVIQGQITIWDNQLNLTTALVFIYAIKNLPKTPHVKGYWSGRGEINSALFGAIVGGVEDILSGTILGPCMLGKSMIGWATAFTFSEIFYKWTSILIAIVLGVFTLVDSLISITSRVILTGVQINQMKILEMLLVQAVVNLPIGWFIKSPREL
ncbi:MAG: hypothetical protein SNJ53_01035 [Thermodesulfovibrionales bacterium]